MSTAYLDWPDRWEIVDEYAAGKPAHVLAREHHHRDAAVRDWLTSLGLWRTPSERTRLWHKTAARLVPGPAAPRKPWLPTPDAVMMDVYDLPSLMPANSDLCNFTPMLTVDIGSGVVLLNRLAEVMGDTFAEYSQNSAFEDARTRTKTPSYDASTLARRRARARIRPWGRGRREA